MMIQGWTKEIQGKVGKQVAREWKQATADPKVEKGTAITAMARLYFRMTPEQRNSAVRLLSDGDAADAAVMLLTETDRILAERILARLPQLRAVFGQLGIGDLAAELQAEEPRKRDAKDQGRRKAREQ